MIKISLLHPSWKRPQLAKHCYDDWMGSADYPDQVEYILSLCDKDSNFEGYKSIFKSVYHKIKGCILYKNGLIDQVNFAAKHSTGNLLIAISDDFSCPEHWDTLLLNALEGKSDYLVKTRDGQQPWIVTLPIMDRVYYEARGYIYHPSTKHMFCDTWITHEAHLMGKVIELPYLFEHQHYTSGKNAKDEVNKENDASWNEGKLVYLEGLKNNFGVQNPLPIKLPKHHIDWLRSEGVIA